MNEDYLWDRTGEPDPEVQELEEVLGTLRYQPRPLVLPVGLQVTSRRKLVPALAIAAAILFALLSAGLWINLRRQQTANPSKVGRLTARHSEVAPSPVVNTTIDERNQKPTEQTRPDEPGDMAANQNPLPHRNKPLQNVNKRKALPPQEEMTAAQRAEGEAAKEQLMFALRVASFKLNLAQRKTQGAPANNSIRNQHKLG